MKALIVASFLIVGCSSTNNPKVGDPHAPAWVHGADSRYPDTTFWMGVGSGKTREQAGQNARGELSKRVQSKISTKESSSTVNESENILTRDYEKQVSLESSAILSGARLVEWYQDPSSKEQFALAIINRGQFLAEITRKIDKLDDALESMSKTLSNSFRAYELIRQREVWEDYFSAVSGGSAVDNPWGMSAEQLESKRREELENHPFNLEGDDVPQQFQAMLEDVGIVLSPSSENKLQVKVTTQNFPSSENLKRVKLTLKVNAHTKRSQHTLILSEIGVAHNEVQAIEDAYAKLKEKQVTKLFDVVRSFGEIRL